MKTCPDCSSRKLKTVQRDETAQLAFKYRNGQRTVSYVARLPVLHCSACGATFEQGADRERFELHVAQAAIGLGVRAGALLRYARKALGFKATELAGILDVSAETISHWENDRTEISPFAWVTLGDLVSDRIAGVEFTLTRLAALRRPKLPSRRIKLTLAGAGRT